MQTASGLEGIQVCETVLSDVDGEAGALTLRGYRIEELAGSASFESVVGLMWDGALLPIDLGRYRVEAFERLGALGDALARPDGMDALRAAIGHLSAGADEREAMLRVTGAMPVFAAAWLRARRGLAPLAPDAALSHAADHLRMVSSMPAPQSQVDALDAYLCTVVDHGLNASTFAARVVASTASDTVSAVVAALGALKGKLHGGAPGPVLDMLDAVGSAERARIWLEAELAAGRRIMGMGHRVYRVRDPRAAVLERALERLGASGSALGRLDLARAVERAAIAVLAERYPSRRLCANVEFYTAVLLEAVGLPRELFTPTFAVGRVAGWCAHIAEQKSSPRILRPSSKYVGRLAKVLQDR